MQSSENIGNMGCKGINKKLYLIALKSYLYAQFEVVMVTAFRLFNWIPKRQEHCDFVIYEKYTHTTQNFDTS